MRILSKPDLKSRGIPYSDVHLSRLEARGEFPKRIKLSEGQGGRVGWIEEEVDAWVAALVAARDGETVPAVETPTSENPNARRKARIARQRSEAVE